MDVDYRAAKTALLESGQAIYYKAIVARIEKLAPVIPTFDYKGDSNIEEIKYRLAQRQMFDLIMNILNPKASESE